MGVSHPSDLAKEILQAINRRKIAAPPAEAVIRLFQIIYHASISREESEFISFHLVFFNPAEAQHRQSGVPVRELWHFIPLECPEEMNLPNISKLALSSHPRSSALAVYPNADGTLIIWGLIDQLNRYEDFIRLENSTAPHRPGLFEARIVGPGHILVTIGYEQIAELVIDNLSLNSIEIFSSGPLLQKLAPGVASLLEDLYSHFPHAISSQEVKERIRSLWMSVIQRLLFRVKGLKYGGAILIVPDSNFEGLNTKYRMHYDRLNSAIKRYALSRYRLEVTRLYITAARQEEIHLLNKKLAAQNSACRESEKEVEAAIWFVALLTRIDGLVLMNQKLEVIGFGVEITTAKEPLSVRKALTANAAKKARRTFNYTYFGTRHRSMMRYCDANPDSVGFVISQDSDVRAITKVDDDVCMWENFRLLPEITPQDAE
ncbi:MAG: hypothetical protein PHF56_10300 [Desulfuromonadaceae bacterium]|nr:hypothetical protein [Desulfuromonadaceae bacterium]